MVLYYTKGLCRPLLDVCNGTGRRREGKGLVVTGPCRYNYYCGPTKDPAVIGDPAFIFNLMLFPPATKRDHKLVLSCTCLDIYKQVCIKAALCSCRPGENY